MINYAHDIRAARYARAWSRRTLADESGLTETDIADIESGGDTDPTPAIAALQLTEIHALTTEAVAHFLRLVEPLAARIDPDRLPVTLADVLAIIGRAAAGETSPPPSTVVVQAGGDISQTNLGA